MVNSLEWKHLREEITIDTIRKVEGIFSVKFPIEYINLITKYHGSRPSPNIIKFSDNSSETLESFLSFDSKDDDYIEWFYKDNRHLFLDDIVPFGTTKYIDLICFDYRNGRDVDPSIVYWNYDLALEDITESIFPICDSFAEFLLKLSSQS